MHFKHLATLALALALALAATTGNLANARDANVQWTVTIASQVIGIRLPPGPALPLPVFSHRPVVVVPAPVLQYEPVHPNRGCRDNDRDGIPNRYDRVDNRRRDRDGDGIPKRHDRHDNRHDNRRWDRDGDGIPNRYDRDDNRRDGWHGGWRGR